MLRPGWPQKGPPPAPDTASSSSSSSSGSSVGSGGPGGKGEKEKAAKPLRYIYIYTVCVHVCDDNFDFSKFSSNSGFRFFRDYVIKISSNIMTDFVCDVCTGQAQGVRRGERGRRERAEGEASLPRETQHER